MAFCRVCAASMQVYDLPRPNTILANANVTPFFDLEWDNEQQNRQMQTPSTRHQTLVWRTLQIEEKTTGLLRAF